MSITKIVRIAVFPLIVMGSLLLSNVALADGNFSECDNLTVADLASVGSQGYCNNGSISQNIEFQGMELYIKTLAPSQATGSIQVPIAHTFDGISKLANSCYVVDLSTFAIGLNTLSFGGDLGFLAGTQPQFILRNTDTCSNVGQAYLSPYNGSPVFLYQNWLTVLNPPAPEILITYPQFDQSIGTPVTIQGTYENNGTYNQFGIDLYYLNAQQQLVNSFVWHTIPVQTASNIPFSFQIATTVDTAYQMILSLNEQGGSNYFETALWDFDTFNLVATDPYEDLDCTSSLDLYCLGKKLFLWTFIPSPETLQSFSTLSVLDRQPFNYPSEIKGVWESMGNGSPTAINLSIPFAGSTINIIDNTKIVNAPYYNLIRTLLIAGMWFMFGMWVYKRGLTLF
jgi:hypothetical protein